MYVAWKLYCLMGNHWTILFLFFYFMLRKGLIHCISDWHDFSGSSRMEETVLSNMGSALQKVLMKVLMVFLEE